jgi:gliding motility-associated-like protein
MSENLRMRGLLLVILFIPLLFFALPDARAQSQTVNNGTSTMAVNFPGACAYTWVNDNPVIGLAKSGSGNIPAFTAVNTGTTPIKATITATPVLSAFAYIANYGSNNVSVISTVSNSVIATIPVGSNPFGVSVSQDGTLVYITNEGDNTVSVIDTKTNMVTAIIPVGSGPKGVIVSADGTRVYVANSVSNTISVIDAATKSVLNTITVGQAPYGVTVSPDGTRVYVTNYNSKSVSVVDPSSNNVVATVPVGDSPTGITVSADGKSVYVSNLGARTVMTISTASNLVTTTTQLISGPAGLVASADGSKVYVADGGYLTIIFTSNNSTFSTASAFLSESIALMPDESVIYLTDFGNNAVDYFSPALTTGGQILVGSQPYSFGNFISKGPGCNGSPITFTITVNPSPVITTTLATGNISSCAGMASSAPDIMQFTVSGNALTGDITATAPTGFEVSLSAGSGYSGSVTLPQLAGAVSNVTVYVRSSASAVIGSITGNIVLSAAGAISVNAAVQATINALPVMNAVIGQSVFNGSMTTPITFGGTGNVYTWTNDTPGIGLAASGAGDINSFTAINTGSSPVKATITVTPGGTGCTGTPVKFTIIVNPAPQITSAGAPSPVKTIYGTPSPSTSFTISATNLSSGVLVTPPAGFEVSTDNITFTLTVTVGGTGNLTAVPVYIRLSAITDVGNYSGNIVLTSNGGANVNVIMPVSPVSPAPLSIKANDITKTYGSVLTGNISSSAFTITSGALKNGNTIVSVSLTYGTGAAATAAVGSYPTISAAVNVGGNGFLPGNYTIKYPPGSIIVTPASLTITPDNKSRLLGAANPNFTISYTGFVNGENALQLTARPAVFTPAIITSPAGQYPITASGAASPNYTINYVPGVLTIEQLPASIIIPNSFTPNGDGVNDFWGIPALAAYSNSSVFIYDRWGFMVYHAAGYAKPWDGTFNGKVLPTGTYYYVIKLGTETKPLSGWVAIIR